MQQYDTIEELTLELALYPNKKIEILENCAKQYDHSWFTVAKDGNCALFDENGDLDDINKVKTIYSNMAFSGISKINIPENVKTIAGMALSNYDQLEEVIFPYGLQLIQSYAFFGCLKLKKIDIPDTVTKISQAAFALCLNLQECKLPENLHTIESYMFKSCGKLKHISIPSNVKHIDSYAFIECSSLKIVEFNDGLQSIGMKAFSICRNLRRITLPSSIEFIGRNAFERCTNISELLFKGKTLEQVQHMDNYPFGIDPMCIEAEDPPPPNK